MTSTHDNPTPTTKRHAVPGVVKIWSLSAFVTMLAFAFICVASWTTGIRGPIWRDGQWLAMIGSEVEPINQALAASWRGAELVLMCAAVVLVVATMTVYASETTISPYVVCNRYAGGDRWLAVIHAGELAVIVAMLIGILVLAARL